MCPMAGEKRFMRRATGSRRATRTVIRSKKSAPGSALRAIARCAVPVNGNTCNSTHCARPSAAAPLTACGRPPSVDRRRNTMCAIAGVVYAGNQSEAVKPAVRRMIAVQRHRGPDGEGFYDTAGASLGHCRLSIIDLSASGHQPMPDPERRYWITFNGEIYNYVELAEELR